MEAGIIGLPKVGKTTLFNTLTASTEETAKHAISSATHVGIARVPDPRLEALRELFDPKRYTPATVRFVDIPGIEKGSGTESLDLVRLREVDALVHVVRAFADPEILHPEGSIDPSRDVGLVDLELILADLEIVERRIQRLDKAKKRGLESEEARELELLRSGVLPVLEDERPLREVAFEIDDERRLRGFQLLSAKPMLVAVNVDESVLAEAEPGAWGLQDTSVRRSVVVSAPIEQEISRLDAAEQSEFLPEVGLEEPSVDRLVRATYQLLGLVSFFTVGEDEVRAWTVRRGTKAREAGRAIHSDIERGFIRAEVVGWRDLLEAGTLVACRERALLRLEGKEYPISDGEVVHFRFNV